MRMGSKDNRSEIKRLLCAFKFAIEGFIHVVKFERNMQIHLVVTAIVILLSFLLSLSKIEVLILLIMVCIVLCLETLNTALERVVDLVTDEYHDLAKAAKDCAAASVFFAAIIAVIIGGIIFYEPLLIWITGVF